MGGLHGLLAGFGDEAVATRVDLREFVVEFGELLDLVDEGCGFVLDDRRQVVGCRRRCGVGRMLRDYRYKLNGRGKIIVVSDVSAHL